MIILDSGFRRNDKIAGFIQLCKALSSSFATRDDIKLVFLRIHFNLEKFLGDFLIFLQRFYHLFKVIHRAPTLQYLRDLYNDKKGKGFFSFSFAYRRKDNCFTSRHLFFNFFSGITTVAPTFTWTRSVQFNKEGPMISRHL